MSTGSGKLNTVEVFGDPAKVREHDAKVARDLRRRQQMHDFLDLVLNKLDRGQREYGDRSFTRDPKALLDEMLEEVADIAGWGAVLAVRIHELKAAIDAAERESADVTAPGKD